MESPAELVGRLGVDLERVRRNTETLRSAAPQVAERLQELLAAAPDPAMAVAGWERLIDVTDDLARIGTLAPDELTALFTVLGGSQPLTNTLHAAGAGWIELFRTAREAPVRPPAAHEQELATAVGDAWEVFSQRLRQLRHREYLRIGMADLTRRYSVESTMTELSALAAGLFAAAYQWAHRTVRMSYGTVPAETQIDRVRADIADDSFVVLAMGKLGGGELNFSSDVDVMYLYEADAGRSSGGDRGAVEPREYYTRLAELVTRALHEVTAAGFAFRVDLRLRPDGVNGPIVNSAANALLYYESYGQTWERTALIQARPIAGALTLGEHFLREIRPFVYRRYLDYATVSDMKDMKARVEAQLGEKVGRGNVKLGRGGIREIEFLVQVMQLIHGGRDERLRGGGSLPALARLVAGGYLPADEGEALSQAYRFLRDVEHKVQIVHQRQTHTVPNEPREQETLARRLGYGGTGAATRLWPELDGHTARVRRSFEQLFYERAAETRRAAGTEMQRLLRSLDDRDASLQQLQALGFANPDASYEHLLLLRDGPPAARARGARQKVLYELAPALLGTILKSPDADLALQNVATFISTIGARTSFLALLRENPGTLRMLIDLFGGSQFLANAFLRHPELLDTLVRADLVRVHRTVEDLRGELASLLRDADDLEDQLDALRRFRNQEFLRIGINDLQGLFEADEVSAELTNLAEVCLQQACKIASTDMCARYSAARLPGSFVIVALGKLGSRELIYNSDLDLIFVYDANENENTTLSAHEFFSKLTQRLITALQVPTGEGIVYRIDTRLRPSGRSGPLVSSFDGFRRYHETSARLWERQALIKARPVAGDPELAERTAAIISAFVYRGPLATENVREIRRLRMRMERELAHESRERMNIKTGRGGLVDVEFLTQMLQLHYGSREPRLRVRNTLAALRVLSDIGVLPAEDYALLSDGYSFLRRVENALRLAHDRPVEDLDRRHIDLTAVAKRLGFTVVETSAGDALWHEYQRRREALRACYERWFERAEAGLD